MRIFSRLFGDPALRRLAPEQKNEVKRLLTDLVKIGETDDYLSVQPGGAFNGRCHHTGARKIGERLHEIGGIPLMKTARAHVERKLKAVIAEHLDHCWSNIGDWQP